MGGDHYGLHCWVASYSEGIQSPEGAGVTRTAKLRHIAAADLTVTAAAPFPSSRSSSVSCTLTLSFLCAHSHTPGRTLAALTPHAGAAPPRRTAPHPSEHCPSREASFLVQRWFTHSTRILHGQTGAQTESGSPRSPFSGHAPPRTGSPATSRRRPTHPTALRRPIRDGRSRLELRPL